MAVLLKITVWLASAAAAGAVAAGKGRSPVIWFMASLVLGPFGLILVLLRRGREDFVREGAVARGLVRPCAGCARSVWVRAESCPHCGQPVAAAP